MKRTELIGHLPAHEIDRMRAIYAKASGVEVAPAAYSQGEVEAAYLAKWRLCAEVAEAFDIDDTREWMISVYTGAIYYTGEFE